MIKIVCSGRKISQGELGMYDTCRFACCWESFTWWNTISV